MSEIISAIDINHDPDTLELKNVIRSAAIALRKSNTIVTGNNCYHVGIFLGTTFSNFKIRNSNAETYFAQGVRAVNPTDFPKGLISYLAGNISIALNIRGENSTISSAQSSGLDALLEAVYFVRRDKNNKAVVVELKETFSRKSAYPILGNIALVISNHSAANQTQDSIEICGLGYAFEKTGEIKGLMRAIDEALAFYRGSEERLCGIFSNRMLTRQGRVIQQYLNKRFKYSGAGIKIIPLAGGAGLFGVGDIISRKKSICAAKKMPVAMFLHLGENTNSSCVLLNMHD